MSGRPSYYETVIREHAAALGRPHADPGHIEAWMRLEHPTLDALSAAQFRSEVAAALACIEAASREQNDALTASFGISVR